MKKISLIEWNNMSPKEQKNALADLADMEAKSTPTEKKRAHPEEDIQRAVVKYLVLKYPSIFFCHVPNGGARTKTEAGIFKSMGGVIPGVADLLIFHSTWGDKTLISHGLALELKAEKGEQSPSQKEFQKRITNAFWTYKIAWSVEEAVKIIDTYLK